MLQRDDAYVLEIRANDPVEPDHLTPYYVMNLWRGKLHTQGAYKTKAEARRLAAQWSEDTHAGNSRPGFNRAPGDMSEVFVVVDSRTGEIVGGRMVVEATRLG